MFSWADTAHFFRRSLDKFLNVDTQEDRNYMTAYAETQAKMKAIDAQVSAEKIAKKNKRKK